MLLHAKFESQVNHFSKRIQGVNHDVATNYKLLRAP